jgi:CO/xanthine dehydrogenase FAD-binding subunit
MDLNTVTEIARPRAREDLPKWTAGDAWLAGGTWLFSEPQVHLRRLIDLQSLGWPSLTIADDALQIAATCTVAELDAFICPPDWTAAPLIGQCCRAFLASFKVWKTATVGGNICLALPAGPMTSLTAALGSVCTLWMPDGTVRKLPVKEFVLGNIRNALKPGELLRQIDIPLASLRSRVAFRQISLTPAGRSAALLIGMLSDSGALKLTVTASTVRPVCIGFASMPSAEELRAAIDASIPHVLYHNDVHGKPDWRKAMTFRLAEQIRAELA